MMTWRESTKKSEELKGKEKTPMKYSIKRRKIYFYQPIKRKLEKEIIYSKIYKRIVKLVNSKYWIFFEISIARGHNGKITVFSG